MLIQQGMNGVEASQAVIIGSSIALNSAYQLVSTELLPTFNAHLFSLYFILPFLAVSMAFLRLNIYKASCFGGLMNVLDTFSWFKVTAFVTLQEWLSQWLQFKATFQKQSFYSWYPRYSILSSLFPKLVGWYPVLDIACQSHSQWSFIHLIYRLNIKKGLLEYSRAEFKKPANNFVEKLVVFLEYSGLIMVERNEENKLVSVSNLTLINLVLVRCGPMREDKCVEMIGLCQIVCCTFAFFIRYGFWWI